ncbi:hypothetical protein Tco_0599031 [Tanacetum coccineum]
MKLADLKQYLLNILGTNIHALYYKIPHNGFSVTVKLRNNYDMHVMFDICSAQYKLEIYIDHIGVNFVIHKYIFPNASLAEMMNHVITDYSSENKGIIRQETQNDYTSDQMVEWAEQEHIEYEETKVSCPKIDLSSMLIHNNRSKEESFGEAIDEEAILEEQILTLMHRFADRFTDRRVEINKSSMMSDVRSNLDTYPREIRAKRRLPSPSCYLQVGLPDTVSDVLSEHSKHLPDRLQYSCKPGYKWYLIQCVYPRSLHISQPVHPQQTSYITCRVGTRDQNRTRYVWCKTAIKKKGVSAGISGTKLDLFLDQLRVDVTGSIIVMIGHVWDVSAVPGSDDSLLCTGQRRSQFSMAKGRRDIFKFNGSTTFKRVSVKEDGFVRYPLNLVDFNAIEPADNKYLIDVVRYVSNVGRTNHLKSGSTNLDFHLANHRGQSIRVTLWGNLREVLVEKKTKQVGACPIVLASTSPKIYNNKVYLSSTSSTMILDDAEIPAIKALKDANSGVELKNPYTPIDLTRPVKGTIEILLIPPRSTVRRVDFPMLRLELDVYDGMTQIVVVLFDEPTTALVGCSAGSLMDTKDESADDHVGLLLAISNLTGTTHVMEIKSQSYYDTLDALDGVQTHRLSRPVRAPTVATPTKPSEPKRTKSLVIEDSDVEASGDSSGVVTEAVYASLCTAVTPTQYEKPAPRMTLYEIIVVGDARVDRLQNNRWSGWNSPQLLWSKTAYRDMLKISCTSLKDNASASTSRYAHTRASRIPRVVKPLKRATLTSAGVPPACHNLGPPSYQCSKCDATMWYAERTDKAKRAAHPTFSLYCQEGSLLPAEGVPLRYAQLYFFDTQNEIRNRMSAFMEKETTEKEWCRSHGSQDFSLRLISKRTASRQYNAPTVSEVAVLVVNNFGDGIPLRDIVVNKNNEGSHRISELHPSYMALQYPLLFPYGEDGFHENIEYYVNAAGLGKRIVLPRSFISSPRYMMQNYQDAMALCQAYGNPDLFITFTSNPKWVEISDMLAHIPGQKSHDRPKIGTRDFKMKLTELMDDLTKRHVFGDCCIVVYVIEFQKRGLSHAHILLWLEERFKCTTPDEINDIIAAELPSPTEDPDGYKVVSEFMLHGPCGKDAKYAPCTTERKCSKHYPKVFLEETVIDEDGYPIYRRQNNKVTDKKGKFTYNNQHVVPYNQYLLLKYQAYINVEWCNRSKAIKYLFKYLNKGPDRATIVIQENITTRADGASVQISQVDKIKNYLNCRFIAPCEAVWRLFSFDIHYSYPTVMQLNYHLPNQNAVTLRDSEDLPALL